MIFVWVTSSAVGFAFIYYPLFPNQLEPPASATSSILKRALHSLYMSIGSLGTFQILMSGSEARGSGSLLPWRGWLEFQ